MGRAAGRIKARVPADSLLARQEHGIDHEDRGIADVPEGESWKRLKNSALLTALQLDLERNRAFWENEIAEATKQVERLTVIEVIWS